MLKTLGTFDPMTTVRLVDMASCDSGDYDLGATGRSGYQYTYWVCMPAKRSAGWWTRDSMWRRGEGC
jgi:hypothetical protein